MLRAPSRVRRAGRTVKIDGPDVIGRRSDQPKVAILFEHVSRPARDAARGEDRGEEVFRHAEERVHGTGIEVDVGVESFLPVDDLLDPAQQVEVVKVAFRFSESAGPLPQDRRPRVFDLVHAMTESHDAFVLRQLGVNDLLGPVGLPYLVQEFDHAFVRAPCSGPFSVPMALVMAEYRSESVDAVTRAANVEALSSWSA